MLVSTLMQVFHWSQPCIRPYDFKVGSESHRFIEKRRKNGESVKKSPTGRYTYRQDMVTTPTRCRVWDVYCTASHRSATTNLKPITDKP